MRDVEEITEVLQDDIKVGKYTGKMSVEEYKQTGSWKLGGIKLRNQKQVFILECVKLVNVTVTMESYHNANHVRNTLIYCLIPI